LLTPIRIGSTVSVAALRTITVNSSACWIAAASWSRICAAESSTTKSNIEATTKAFEVLSKTAKEVATEIAEYSKTSYENGSKAAEKLFGVKSLDKAIEVQSEYAKSMFEDFTARTTKIGQLYADLGKEVFKPFAANMSKAAAAK
jgi:hypothetical protein